MENVFSKRVVTWPAEDDDKEERQLLVIAACWSVSQVRLMHPEVFALRANEQYMFCCALSEHARKRAGSL